MNSHKTCQIWMLIWAVQDWMDGLSTALHMAAWTSPPPHTHLSLPWSFSQHLYTKSACVPSYCILQSEAWQPDSVITMFLQSHIYLAKYLNLYNAWWYQISLGYWSWGKILKYKISIGLCYHSRIWKRPGRAAECILQWNWILCFHKLLHVTY